MAIDQGSTILDADTIPRGSPDDGGSLPVRIQQSYTANGTLIGVTNVTGNVTERVSENVTEWATNVVTRDLLEITLRARESYLPLMVKQQLILDSVLARGMAKEKLYSVA